MDGGVRLTEAHARASALRATVDAIHGRPDPHRDCEAILATVPSRLRGFVAAPCVSDAGEACAACRSEARAAATRWLAHERTLRKAVAALDSGGIDHVLLKGASIATRAYPEPWQRFMNDIDLWVPRLDDGVAALVEAGFRIPPRHAAGPHGQETSTYVLADPSVPIPILEVHDEPLSLRRLPTGERDRLWADAVQAGFSSARVLTPTDELLHICMHNAGTDALVTGLAGYVDVALMARRLDGGAWRRLTRDAEAAGASREVWALLEVARSTLGVAIPASVTDALAPSAEVGDRLLEATRDAMWPAGPVLTKLAEQVAGGGGSTLAWVRARVARHWRLAGERISFAPVRAVLFVGTVVGEGVARLAFYARVALRGGFGRDARARFRSAKVRWETRRLLLGEPESGKSASAEELPGRSR